MNIFDVQDSQVLKAENLRNLGYDEKAVVPLDESRSMASSIIESSRQSSLGRSKATNDYLSKGN